MSNAPTVGSFDIWLAGLRSGIATLASEPMLGLKRVLLPSSYWRTAEFAYVMNRLHVAPGGRVFDLGSPKDLATFLARDAKLGVVAADILPDTIALSERYARAQGLSGDGIGQVRSELQDGRQLTYADATFDGAFSVSVLEHVPDTGDSAAIRELVRIVKPGGRIVVTTPYALTYRETFVEGTVYERAAGAGEKQFFERHYDEASLRRRLLDVPGTTVEDLQLIGEGPSLQGERLLSTLGPLRTVFSPFEAALAAACLRRVEPGNGVRPMAAFFTLRKAL